MNSNELKIYQRPYRLGMLNERRKWQNSKIVDVKDADPQSLVASFWQFIRSGLQI